MRVPHKKIQISASADSAQPTERSDYNATVSKAQQVPSEDGGSRLDQGIARLWPEYSRSRLQNWIRQGHVRLDGEIVWEPKRKLLGGERVELDAAPDEKALSSQPEEIVLDIVHEDDSIIIVNKPAGLVVHPGSGNWHGTLLNALLYHDSALEGVPRAGIVHRLDKETSGLMVVAKTLQAQTDLVRQLQMRTVRRHYRALVRGNVENGGTVDAPIGRHPTQRTKMAVVRTGKLARTHYRIVERFADCTLIECALETGRTHQIRVHMASIGHPLVGDPVYGGGVSRVPVGPGFQRQALHACRLGLFHPASGKSMFWKSPLPDDMAELLVNVQKQVQKMDSTEEEGDWEVTETIYAYGDDTEDEGEEIE